MADDTGAPEVQGTTDAQADEADAQAQGADAPAQGAASSEGGPAEASSLMAKIADLERDNLAYRERERKREQAEKRQAQTEASESGRLAERVADLERQLAERTVREQEQSLRLASMTAAQRLGYRNPEIAYRLLDTKAIVFDEDGAPTNVDALLEGIGKSDPYLLTHTDFGGGQRGASAAAVPDMNAMLRRAAGR